MPRKENPATRADPTPGKTPRTRADRGQRRPAADWQNRAGVAEAGERDRQDGIVDVQSGPSEGMDTGRAEDVARAGMGRDLMEPDAEE